MSRKSLLIAIIFVGLVMVCIGVFFSAVLLWVPGEVTRLYGEPAPGLSRYQRIILSTRLLLDRTALLSSDRDAETQAFEVQLGDSPQVITGQLEAQGLIPEAEALLNYMIYKGFDTTLQAGVYELSAKMEPIEIAQALQDATPKEITLNILPGWRLEEIAASLPTSGLTITPEQFMERAVYPPQESTINQYLPPDASLEGYLPPGSYQLPRDTGVDDLVNYLANRFIGDLDSQFLEGFQKQGLTLFQAVTLASIIEREAVNPVEMPLIASVFLNRLGLGMKLESDPTVQYSLGYDSTTNSWWKVPLTLADLEIDSPYNTYLYAGLPPGPISTPGVEALRAVAEPQVSPYLFFRAKCDDSGEHNFAETFEEHLLNACP